MRGATDEQHLEFAHAVGRVLFTQDEDFLQLHATGKEHSGIVFTSQGMSIGNIIRGLMLVFQLMEPEEMKNHVEYL